MGLIGPEGRKQLRVAGRFAGVGFELAAAVLLGFFGGGWIDSQIGTTYVAYIGLALGIVAGFRSLFQAARSAQNNASDSHSEPPS